MIQPIVDMQGKDGKVWNITAATGTLVGENEIRLQNNVVIIDSTKTLRFESERLNYFSDTQMANTDDAVKLQHAADVTTALGMRANLNTNRIELMRNVDSRYVQTQ
jgi:lipopolysaccharide export system protein LptC